MTAPVPAISVLLPVHNAGRYLGPALESILAQSAADFELIALDDGSTDGSGEQLEARAAADPRIRVIRQENRGLVATLNRGIGLARAPLLARMDADDIARPDRFRDQLARFDADPGLVALGGQFMLIDPDGRPLRSLPMPPGHEEIDARHLDGAARMGICHPTAMIRTEALRRAGGYQPGFEHAEDIDLWLRLAEIGGLANLPGIVLDYRMHPASIGHTRRAAQQASAWRAAAAAARRRGLAFDLPEPRPTADRPDPGELYRKWAWWALGGGHPASARHYARKAVLARPWSWRNWHLALVALRGR